MCFMTKGNVCTDYRPRGEKIRGNAQSVGNNGMYLGKVSPTVKETLVILQTNVMLIFSTFVLSKY